MGTHKRVLGLTYRRDSEIESGIEEYIKHPDLWMRGFKGSLLDDKKNRSLSFSIISQKKLPLITFLGQRP